MPGVETRLYQFIGRIAAVFLGRLDPVVSVYTRRSVACGEVVFGRSDIDLHILFAPFADVNAEARFLKDLAVRHAGLKRLLLCLGDCDASTQEELAYWYQTRPYIWYRDRGWLKLYGKEAARSPGTLTSSEERDSLVTWFFWAWERLPGFYRAENVRTCCNLFLDMVNAYGLYIGAFDAPQRRAEVLRYWRGSLPPSREREELQRGFHSGFRGNYRALTSWLYRESLRLCDTLYAHVAQKLEGEGCRAEVRSCVPFAFSQKRYFLVDPLRLAEVAQALTVMQKSPEVCVTTEKTLKLYLYHRNPWEYEAIRTHEPAFPLSPPPPEAFRRGIRRALHREIPRRAGFSIGKKTDRGSTIGYHYAQCRMYSDYGKVAATATDLVQQYERSYGTWPYKGNAARDDYFLHDYPIICKTIDDLSRLPPSNASERF
jgi:predicted nucleotidyltransferase